MKSGCILNCTYSKPFGCELRCTHPLLNQAKDSKSELKKD